MTWPEFVSALDAWKECVAADGYELRIDIDESGRSYQAIGPTVEIAGAEAEPADAGADRSMAPSNESIEACRSVHVTRLEQFRMQQ